MTNRRGARAGDREREREDVRGAASVLLLAAVVTLSGLVLSSAVVTSAELVQARRSLDQLKTRYIAEAGLERAIAQLTSATDLAPFDPLFGVRATFDDGAGGYEEATPFVAEPLLNGGARLGDYTVSMTAADRNGGIDVTIVSTGYFPAAPVNLPAGSPHFHSSTVTAVVRFELEPGRVFDHAYFVNNWGWFYGSTILANGNAASNGQFDAGNYAPTVQGQPTYDRLVWNGGNADLQGYRDDNGDGLQDGNDGGIFSGWDIVNVANVQGVGGNPANQHPFEPQAPMPNLSDLTVYEQKALAAGGSITIGGTPISNAVYGDEASEKQNLYLRGTAANPIVIDGTVVVRGNVIISGVVRGKGAIYAGGNVYVPNNVVYENPPTTPRPADRTEATTEAWLTANKDKDMLGLFAKENIVVGNHLDATWRSNVSSWLSHSMNSSKEDAGEDFIPNTGNGRDGIADTADDDVLEDDGTFTTAVYTQAEADAGLIPPGFAVGDPVPGTGEDIDGDGVYDGTIGLANLDFTATLTSADWGNIPAGPALTYGTIASNTISRLDGVFYTNHAFCWLTLSGSHAAINGSLVCRNESIIYGSPSVSINYDCRLLGGSSGLAGEMLPSTLAPVRVLAWSIALGDANRALSQ